MTEPEVTVRDFSLMDHVTRHRFVETDGEELTNQVRQDPLPEEYMDRLEDCLGDGNAAVTVGGDVTTSVDYGNKAGAFVSVKVTCGSDEENIVKAHGIARELVERFVAEDQAEMEKVLGQARGGGPRTPATAKVPAKAMGKAPPRGPKPGGKPLPDLRR